MYVLHIANILNTVLFHTVWLRLLLLLTLFQIIVNFYSCFFVCRSVASFFIFSPTIFIVCIAIQGPRQTPMRKPVWHSAQFWLILKPSHLSSYHKKCTYLIRFPFQMHNLKHLCVCVHVFLFVQVTLSGRDIDKGISVRTSGAQISAIPSNETEGSVFSLTHSVFRTWSKKFQVLLYVCYIFYDCVVLLRLLFLYLRLIDLNCLTLTLNEYPTKTKNNFVVSRG